MFYSDSVNNQILQISSVDAYSILSSCKDSYLIDVRTYEEWALIGVPDLKSPCNGAIRLSWRFAPDMKINKDFVQELSRLILNKTDKLLFLCRSGGRSLEAATAMNNNEYANCYNITDGFEGSTVEYSGWQASNLPWRK